MQTMIKKIITKAPAKNYNSFHLFRPTKCLEIKKPHTQTVMNLWGIHKLCKIKNTHKMIPTKIIWTSRGTTINRTCHLMICLPKTMISVKIHSKSKCNLSRLQKMNLTKKYPLLHTICSRNRPVKIPPKMTTFLIHCKVSNRD